MVFYSVRHQSKFEAFEKELLSSYEIRSLDDITSFLKIRVLRERTERKIWLLLDTFYKKIANKFHIPLDIKPPFTPLPTTVDLSAYLGTATPGQVHSYQQKVGNINYAAINTRPDIARASAKLSEFLRNPSPGHIDAVDHLMRYLVGTRYLAIEYNGLDLHNIRTFLVASDASFADTADRKSL